ncbi:hypothetical protein [Congregibacter litoralis]|uniref:Periplasmic component of the Tol biopolymer transport system n=1 Tax=Congregibacter litoralis KT71 TaxID=314285 RepID=A4A341_9GAMM|nr:hypothetical protein [Congregibacter litoralis]EAQ99116.1 hypothetical protein KT71_15641 [Congregibacter litoralis KT71]
MSRFRSASGKFAVPGLVLALAFPVISGCDEEEASVSAAQVPADSSGDSTTAVPEGTDVWLLDLVMEENSLRAVQPRNLTSRPGYDNQPYFLPTGELLYVQMAGEKTDLWRWIPGSKATSRFTTTVEESEFSPTPIPQSDGGVSYIRSRTNTSGRLWQMPQKGADAEIVFADIGPVGYHAWFDADHVALWLLQEPSLLQVVTISTGEAQPIARGVGRSPQSVPNRRAVSFTRPSDEGTLLEVYDLDETAVNTLAILPEGGEFHAWMPDGRLLSTAGSQLFQWRAGAWESIADLGLLDLNLSRLAVSPDGSRLALVAEPSH